MEDPSRTSRAVSPWLCLGGAWVGMAVLWAVHAFTPAPAAGSVGVETVSGVIASVRATRVGGAFLRVACDDGSHFVMLSPSLGRIDGVAVGGAFEASGVWQPLGRLRVLLPCSRSSVRVGTPVSHVPAAEPRGGSAP